MVSVADKVAAKAIKMIAGVFPEGGRYILPALMQADRAYVLSTCLSRSVIESVVVHGRQGIFEGSARDVSVILKYALEGEWSPRTVKRIADRLSVTGGTYIDIGANIGLTAIPVALAGAAVIAFEPVPLNVSYLTRNIALNGVSDRIVVHNCAVLDGSRTVEFELSAENHGDHRLRNSLGMEKMGENTWSTIQVHGRALDDLLKPDTLTAPLIIKMDTQGSEPIVIAGGKRTFALAEMIICEFSPYQMARMGSDVSRILALLREFSSIEIYVGESEDAEPAQAADAAVAFLEDYNRKWQDEPYGRYLNVIATRELATA